MTFNQGNIGSFMINHLLSEEDHIKTNENPQTIWLRDSI